MKEEALKLADYLEELPITYGDDIQDGFFKAVAMIRRLVEELEELKHDNEELLKSLNAERKQGEPVAWRGANWSHSPDDYLYRDFDDPFLDSSGNNVGEPLYTTPQTKPLSDKKIAEAMVEVDPIELGRLPINVIRGFARAIEERHGIK